MADRTIGSLPKAPDLYDDSLLVIEQQGAAASLEGRQIKRYAQEGVSEYVEDAKKAAADAQEAVKDIGTAVKDAQSARDEAETARRGAETARKAVEDMEVSVDTLPAGSPASVSKTSREGHVLLAFGLPAGARGPQGKTGSSISNIARTSGTGAPGTADTYTITLTDGSTFTFQVHNGANGQGAGDMTAAVYDPSGKKQDIFIYADKAAAALLPVIHAVTLKEAAWTGTAAPYSQTVSVPGVLPDPLKQIIQPAPADGDSLTAWNTSSVRCTAQGNGTLAFSARDRPAADILLQVAVQAARSYEGGTNS